MKTLVVALAALVLSVASYGQGQVVFANKVGTAVDAPVTLFGDPPKGPGPDFSAQLFLEAADGSLTPLTPASTFRAAGIGAAAIADRYWVNQTVDVPVAPGNNATFIVRAWLTSLGSFDLAKAAPGGNWGQSPPVTVAVGGNTLPPSNLVGLQAFTVGLLPEPSIIALGVLGGSALLLFRRK